MCIAIPLKIERIEGEFAYTRAGELRQKVNIQMLKDPKPGDYCLVHAGFAIQKLDRREAKKTLRIIKQIK